MKQIKMIIHEPLINKVIGNELNLLLNKKTSLLDAINEVDKMIMIKGGFPVPDYQSLLHMIYNPVQNRFYKQVAVTVHDEKGQQLNMRETPNKALQSGATIIVIPAGGCISEWEESIDYKTFKEFLKTK